MRVRCPLPPGAGTRVVQVIIADAYLLVAKSLSADPRPLGRIRYDRYIDAAQAYNVFTESGGKAEHAGARLQQKNCRRHEVPAGKCGFAELPVQFSGGFRIQYGFVGCTQCRECTRDVRLQKRQLPAAVSANSRGFYAVGRL